ncbi:MAG: hypothetical protein KGJ13_09345 [Patescibacteria group bacterium]|nr:hypothetical protein [Patescibacteria group bacterium]
MTVEITGHEVIAAAKKEAASRLLDAAIEFQRQHMQRLNTSAEPERRQVKFRAGDFIINSKGRKITSRTVTVYTNPSKPGEYPHKRTGFGQSNVLFGPTDPEDIAKDLTVRMGVSAGGSYLEILEFLRDRKGFLDTMRDIEPQLKTILET